MSKNICPALLVGVTIVTLLGSVGKAIAFHPPGHTYEVRVTPSYGGMFTDCFRYMDDGTLIIDSLGIPGVYAHDLLGLVDIRTQGINADTMLGLATHASHLGTHTVGAFTRVKGDAISTMGGTFTFEGFENPGCEVGGSAPQVNPYKPR